MSTLEKLQAAAKAKLSAGQSLAATPVSNAPTAAVKTSPQPTSTATVATKAPSAVAPTVKAPVATAATSPQIQQEIQRKSAAGIALTNPTAASSSAYKAAQPAAAQSPAVAVKTAVQPTSAPTTAAAMSNTNYIANGGSALNEILYNKGIYNTSNKNYVANTVKPLYDQLDQKTAAMVKGMNYDQLRDYINGLGSQNTATTQNEGMALKVAEDPYALALKEYEQQLAMLEAGAQSTEKDINRRYDYANNVTQDNRQLETASFYRNNAPTAWDGSTGYQAAMTDRNRNIDDHYTQESLNDNVAAAYSNVNAFRNNANNFISTKANELQTQAQQLAMQEAGLTGSYKGQQTMQGASSAANTAGQLISNQGQQIANQIAQINLDNYPAQVKLQLQQLQQQVNSGAISNQTAQYQLQQLTDPNSATNQAQALDLQMKQIDASNYSQQQKLQLEQLRKTVAEIGKVPYQSDTDARLDQLKVLTAEAELQKLQETAAKPASKTYEDYQSNIEKLAVRDSKSGALKNPEVVEEYILNAPLSEYEMYRAYRANGLKWGGEVPSPGE
ncbi:hypothetical protein R50345_06115 [Paenibacillus sp. FSL R5-0345]|uniref:hypothetical protein n=1 Tax=Paenibacillus sp. FSL R5-0345 TaxID=1536770 RepID=UPI0004F5FF5F|nr:hypothetical protein [Paenibacillus sp. FSL R5-0345]AIQ34229.1 hypothetical protein R50345_06115 [Paenibacillus sp. FSL R5-0345]